MIAALPIAVGLSAAASAQQIVDVDGLVNCQPDQSGTNAVEVPLEAGTYQVTPIDESGGGAYTALNRWGNVDDCDPDGSNCDEGWRHRYRLFAPDVEEQSLGIGNNPWETAQLAFDNDAESTSFTLPTAQTVSFYAPDDFCSDNTGGASLEIALGVPAVPFWGLLLLVGALIVAGLSALRFRTA